MNEKAVIDRFEEEWAVLLVGEDELRLNVARAELPAEAREGDWLRVEIEDGHVVSAEMEAEAKEEAQERIMSKLERLRRGEHRSQNDG